MITDFEQMDHARSHIGHAARHIESAVGHLKNAAKTFLSKSIDELQKMAGASMIHSAYEMGRANEQTNMAAKHSHSVLGRPGWDGSSDHANEIGRAHV